MKQVVASSLSWPEARAEDEMVYVNWSVILCFAFSQRHSD